MPAEAQTFWIDTFKKMNATPTWKSVLEKYGWSDALVTGADFGKDMEEEAKITQEVLEPLGLIPTKK
jgi:putative tricarboxylic transport membrane protein